MKTIVALLILILAMASTGFAAEPIVLPVWPDTAPGEAGDIGEEKIQPPKNEAKAVIRITDVTKPTLTVYQPEQEKSTGAAVLICPGGGYNILAWDLEGTEVAEWLNSLGVTGIVLKYRVPRQKDREKHDAPLQDAQRAMSIVRQHAAEWGIDKDRIGILGFSAGGHLAASAATNYDHRHYEKIDKVDNLNCRPDFAVLVYPAYLSEGTTLNPEIRVTSETPPTFFAHASDDGISSENSIAMYLALKHAKVSAEMHIYSSGGHGFGLRRSAHPASSWPKRCEEWMESRSLLKKK